MAELPCMSPKRMAFAETLIFLTFLFLLLDIILYVLLR